MNESDLKKTWCPYARVPVPVQQHVRGMAGSPVETVSVNRNADGSIPAAARCIGSACSQFRVKEIAEMRVAAGSTSAVPLPGVIIAYCGRAGKP